MTLEQDDEFNNRKLEEIGLFEARLRGKRGNWLIVFFVGAMMLSPCMICTILMGHDLSSIVSTTVTPKNAAIPASEESDQALQEQISYLESLQNSEQQLGNDPSSWEQWLNAYSLQYENSTYLGNITIADYNDTLEFFGPGSDEYLNITEILQGAYAGNGNESAYYNQLINEFNEEYGEEFDNLAGI